MKAKSGQPDRHEIGLRFFQLQHRLIRLQERVLYLSTVDLTSHQYRLLELISSGWDSLTKLGKGATISLPAISAALTTLTDRGYLQQDRLPGRRGMVLTVTETGHKARLRARAELERLIDELMGDLDPEIVQAIDAVYRALWPRAGEVFPRGPDWVSLERYTV